MYWFWSGGNSSGASIDTIQNITSTWTVTAWASIVTIAPISNTVITLPQAVGNLWKTVKIVRTLNNAFTVSVVPFAWDTVTGLNNTTLNGGLKWIILEVTGATAITQIADVDEKRISDLVSAISTNTVDNTLFAQTWNWSTATTQNPISLTATALTTGSLLNLSVGANATAINTNGRTVQAVGVTTNTTPHITTGSINDFLEVKVKNTSTGIQAQSWFTAEADNGSASSGFAWMWINNSAFNFPTAYNIGGINDVTYVWSGQDMHIANANTTKDIILSTGTALTPFFNERIRLKNNGNLWVGTNAPASTITNNGSTGFVPHPLWNFATSGSIGTALTTVDIKTHFTFNPTASNVSLTIPTPTVTTQSKLAFFTNISNTFSVGVGGMTIWVWQTQGFLFNTTQLAWTPIWVQNVLAENGSVYSTAVATIAVGNTNIATSIPVPWLLFTPLTTGNFAIDVNLTGLNLAASNSRITFALVNTATPTVAITNSERNMGFISNTITGQTALSGSLNDTFPLVGGQSYQVVAWNPNASGGSIEAGSVNGRKSLSWNKVSWSIPITGQTTDYAAVEQHSAGTGTNLSTITSTNTTTSGTLLTTANRVVLTGSTIKGNLTVTPANGTITIAKSGVYTFMASVSIQSAGTTGQWGQIVKNNATVIATSPSYSQTSSAGMQIVLNYTGDFASGDVIDVRLNSTAAGTIGVTGYSYSLTQEGTSASIKQTLAKVQGTFNGSSGTGLLLATTLDTLGSWNAGTWVFTAPRTADYNISGSIAFQSTNTYSNGYEILYLGGAVSSRIAWGFHWAYTGYWGMSWAITVRLTQGQQIYFQCTKTTLIQTGVDSNISISEQPNDFIN
jgi:hypothetical protein